VAGSAAFDEIQDCLGELADPVRAEHSKGFFKTGPGEYGEGDVFLGLKVPDMRKVARRFHNLTLADVRRLLRSPLHEYRLTALFILVRQFKKADERGRTRIYDLYLKNTRYVNNWDLVDSSAHQIVGGYLADKDFGILLQLVKSYSLWERRIAIIATYHLIKRDDFT
jgi:3-methyladenine DNA glycosylase AlkD